MTLTGNVTTQPIQPSSLAKRMFIGAGIALAIICLFVFSGKAKTEWGSYWMIKPLLLTPLAGAGGGAYTYFIDRWLNQPGWQKALAIVLSIVGFVIALFVGIVLGLNGTMWD